MQRRLINIVAAGSLALCVAVCALWVRSHFVAIEVSMWEGNFRAGNPWTIGLGSDRGMLWVRRSRIFGDGPPSRLFVQRTARAEFWKKPPQAGISAENAPVDRGRSPKAKGYRWHVYLPHWAIALVLIALPLWRAVRWLSQFQKTNDNEQSINNAKRYEKHITPAARYSIFSETGEHSPGLIRRA